MEDFLEELKELGGHFLGFIVWGIMMGLSGLVVVLVLGGILQLFSKLFS